MIPNNCIKKPIIRWVLKIAVPRELEPLIFHKINIQKLPDIYSK